MTSEPEPDDGQSVGQLRPISGAALAICVVIGLVAGWAAHPLWQRMTGTAPLVTWMQALVLLFVAAIVGFLAWQTWRTLHKLRIRMDAGLAVNRLVLARACALMGALVGGAYAGYAVSWLGDPSELADQRIVRSLVAAAGGLAIVVTSLLLERACRAPHGDVDA